MGSIFISYRRQDSADVSGRIYEHLVARYGKQAVFMDVDTIPYGEDFAQFIQDEMKKCSVALVIIGPSWLNSTTENSQRRLDDPRDFVRIEIETALGLGIPVVPVLVSHAHMPGAEAAPKSLGDLLRKNAAQVRPNPDFATDIKRLCDTLDRYVPPAAIMPAQYSPVYAAPQPSARSASTTPSPTPKPPPQNSKIGRRVWLTVGALLILTLACGAVLTQQLLSRVQTANASATQTATVRLAQVYHAAPAPGPNCDQNGASWSDINGGGICASDGFQLSGADTITFHWYQGLSFPLAQQVDVGVNFDSLGCYGTPGGCSPNADGSPNACIEIFMRSTDDFSICPDGTWIMLSGTVILRTGRVAAASAYMLTASCTSTTMRYSIGGSVIGETTERSVAAGDSVSIYNNMGGIAVTISNFTFTPLGH
jgi:hypothetical protein